MSDSKFWEKACGRGQGYVGVPGDCGGRSAEGARRASGVRGRAGVGRDWTRVGEGSAYRQERQRRAVLPDWRRHGASDGDRQGEVRRRRGGEETSLERQSVRLRSFAILARRS